MTQNQAQNFVNAYYATIRAELKRLREDYLSLINVLAKHGDLVTLHNEFGAIENMGNKVLFACTECERMMSLLKDSPAIGEEEEAE